MTNSMAITRVVSYFMFPDRCYPVSTRTPECEYGCKSTLECIRWAAIIM